MIRRFKTILFLILVTLTLAACGGGDAETETKKEKPTTAPKPVTFTIKNNTGMALLSVSIDSTDRGLTPMSYGGIAKAKKETLKNKVVPPRIEVHYSKPNKERKSIIVNLEKACGSGYTGPVHLTIQSGDKISARKGS
ncbi:hypothetical protein [Poriferisphaera sp. WC338]|uniref:hypothetical protein n=1 Tax=Poriferisphaera sp. WC338 TaxID=3425129 RepID=UPI003D819C46